MKACIPPELPDDHSECEPPDPIPNSEVKPLSADGSVGSPHVRVGHCQAPLRSLTRLGGAFYVVAAKTLGRFPDGVNATRTAHIR